MEAPRRDGHQRGDEMTEAARYRVETVGRWLASQADQDAWAHFPPGQIHVLGWVLARRNESGDPRQCAVAYDVADDGYLVSYTFAMTAAGVVDLVATSVEWCGYKAAADRARQIADHHLELDAAPRGLTSRRVRAATAHAGLLAEARQMLQAELSGWAFAPDATVRRAVRDDGRDDEFFARLVVTYTQLIGSQGRGARRALAAEHEVSEATVRNWISEAKNRGLWATSGPGRPGQPTKRAREILQEAGS